MPGLGDTMQTSAGPLPVWAWAGLGTVGVAGYLIYRKKKQMAAQAADGSGDSSNLGNVPISNLVVGAEPMSYYGGDTFVDVQDDDKPTPPAPPTKPPPKKSPPPPSKVPPPIAHPGSPNQPIPNPVPAPKARTYTVVSGDTLWGIAKKFYGDGNLWQLIYNANKAKIGPNANVIKPGQVLTIPTKP